MFLTNLRVLGRLRFGLSGTVLVLIGIFEHSSASSGRVRQALRTQRAIGALRRRREKKPCSIVTIVMPGRTLAARTGKRRAILAERELFRAEDLGRRTFGRRHEHVYLHAFGALQLTQQLTAITRAVHRQ